MVEINLFDNLFSHLATPIGNYSISPNKEPKYTRYVKNRFDFNGITLFTDSNMLSKNVDKVNSKYKIGWLPEPPAISPHVYRSINSELLSKFDFVLTFDDDLLRKYPSKTRLIPFGCTFVPRSKYSMYRKTKLVNMIYSSKNFATGHKLRHQISKTFPEVDFFGSGANSPFVNKESVLSDYMFSIVVENTKNNFYFTEKILDSLAVGTIPIYWGAKRINFFLNADGILSFDSISELDCILKNLTPEKYHDMLPYAQENFDLIKKYDVPENWLYENIFNKLEIG